MPRRIVYGISLWVFIAATALTIASIALPNWISYTSPTPTLPGHEAKPIHITYGLHVRCSSLTGECTPFPEQSDCRGEDRHFCSLWRTVGFLMSLTIVLELASFVGFAVIILGGRKMRESGWKMVSGLLGIVAVVQIAAMAIVAFVNDHDARFAVGWGLDKSTILCTVSWVLLVCDVGGLLGAAYVLPPEDDYEPIPDRR